MSSYLDITRQIGYQWVESLKRAEEAVSVLSENISKATADMPKPRTPRVPEGVSKLSDALKDQLPEPSEVVKANFELTERLLAAQKELTLKVLTAAAERRNKDAEDADDEAAEEEPAKAPAKSRSTKSTTKK